MRRRGTLLLDLRRDLDDLWKGVDYKRRKEIRHAERMGCFQIDFDPNPKQREEWLDLYRTLEANIGQDFSESFIRGLLAPGSDHTLVTVSQNGILLSGELFYRGPAWTDPSRYRLILRFSATAKYLDDRRRAAGLAHALLVWKSIEQAKKDGFVEYDFGGWNPYRPQFAGVNSFKESFGGTIWWMLTNEQPAPEQIEGERNARFDGPEKAVIWFDDGHRSIHEIALPIFKRMGLKAIVALVTGSVGKNLEASSEKEYPIMTVDQVRELVDEGWEIASHSVTHPHFPTLSPKDAEEELVESKSWIVENLGFTPTKFVAPFGRLAPDQFVIARRHYEYIRPLIPPRPPQPGGIHAIFHRIISPKGNRTWTNAVPPDVGFSNWFFPSDRWTTRDAIWTHMSRDPKEINLAIYNSRAAIHNYEVYSGLQDLEVAAFREHLQLPPARVLDMGCGAGRTTTWFKENGYSVIGIDIAKQMIQRAQHLHPQIEFRVGDAVSPDFPDGSFDYVLFSYNGIDNIYPDSNREKCLREFRRILIPNGKLIFSSHNDVWRKGNPDRCEPFEPPFYKYRAIYGMIIIRFITKEEQKIQLERTGFQLLNVYGAENSPWLYYVAMPKLQSQGETACPRS